jgi:MFS family permease
MDCGSWPISYSALLGFALVMGAAYGGLVALSPAVVAELLRCDRALGAMLGALFSSSAISSLAGPPLVGLLIDWTGNVIWPPLLAGVTGVLAFVVQMPLGRQEPREPGRGEPSTSRFSYISTYRSSNLWRIDPQRSIPLKQLLRAIGAIARPQQCKDNQHQATRFDCNVSAQKKWRFRY